MKRENSSARRNRRAVTFALILFAFCLTARAQTVIPRVCIDLSGQTPVAYFGYQNTNSSSVVIPKGVLTKNYFTPGSTTYAQQITIFQPGIHDNVFSIPLGGQPGDALTWNLDGNAATVRISAALGCAQMNYQGRLTSDGAAANGNYDFQFTLYDAATGGAAQSDSVSAPNVAVTNGVFAVNLNFASSLTGNANARFIEIRVRPTSQNASNPYTVLSPRQTLTSAPSAINAQKAFDVQLVLTNGAPPAAECNTNLGQMRFDAANNKIYICGAAGWKYTTLQ